MRDADTILATIQARGTAGKPLLDVYRMLYCKELYLRAYAKLYPNKGALTKGATDETVDGMSQEKIDTIIEALRSERYRWTPARRIHIPKANGKTRPLGLPTWSDKLLQEVLRMILEAYFEPQFDDASHGFRPGRGCHTALTKVQRTWNGTRWFIEGDISSYFDFIDHDLLVEMLAERILDNRFLRLIRNLLQAGYLEEWKFNKTMSGTPQGGVLSPLLANVFLDRFDRYVTGILIPKYTRGERRKGNPHYQRLERQIRQAKVRREGQKAKALRKQYQRLPAYDQTDPDYRRLRYIRYADDWLLGFVGPKREAEVIKADITAFLREHLKLELSQDKTLITHATSEAAHFLGYDIVNQQDHSKRVNGVRSINGRIGLRVPADTVRKFSTRYVRHGKPIHRAELLADSDYAIVTRYQQEYRGIAQYYALAYNVGTLNTLHWIMRTSLLKTLAHKHKTSVMVMCARYKATCHTAEGVSLSCLEVKVEREGKPPLVARFGGILLRRQKLALLHDHLPEPINTRTEILERLLADVCELCGSTSDVEVHHIRKLADLKGKGGRELPGWKKLMIARQRKTLVACRACHMAIHTGTIDSRLTGLGKSWTELLESRVR